jgi:hypothetical protein
MVQVARYQIEWNEVKFFPDVKCQAKKNKVEPLSGDLDIPQCCPSG